MSERPSDLDFVAIGLDEAVKNHLEKLVDKARVKFIESVDEFDAFVDGFELDNNATIFVGSSIADLGSLELGQMLRGSYINAHIVFLATDAKNFSISELKKNGYSKALLLPTDQSFFEELVVASSRGGVRKRFKAIKMVDIAPGEHLEFSVYFYMPANKKYGLLTAGGGISEKKYERLRERAENTVFVEMDQVEKFYEYSAEKIAKLNQSGSGNGSETERVERLRQNIQALFHNIFDQKVESSFDSGRDLMEQSHQIVQKFVEVKTKINLKQQISNILDVNGDSYSHAQAVSSLASLLSMAIGVGAPEELAIAGLFHDVGITGFPIEPTPLNMHTLSKEEMERYAAHPIASINMLKNKKFVLTPSVTEIIEKHHERIDGKGFPAALPAHKIPLTSQLLAFADWFEYLMRPQEGRPRLSPLEATEKIHASAGLSVELIVKIRKFFSDMSREQETASEQKS